VKAEALKKEYKAENDKIHEKVKELKIH